MNSISSSAWPVTTGLPTRGILGEQFEGTDAQDLIREANGLRLKWCDTDRVPGPASIFSLCHQQLSS